MWSLKESSWFVCFFLLFNRPFNRLTNIKEFWCYYFGVQSIGIKFECPFSTYNSFLLMVMYSLFIYLFVHKTFVGKGVKAKSEYICGIVAVKTCHYFQNNFNQKPHHVNNFCSENRFNPFEFQHLFVKKKTHKQNLDGVID